MVSALTATPALAALCFATAPIYSAAKPEFVARLPNGANVPGVDALGHLNTAGDGPRNQFGKDFDAASRKWTTTLCQKDSDDDGQTNGQELGDPCCAFVVGSNAKVLWTTGVSHPGDKTQMSDASLWAAVSCSNGAAAASSANATGNSSTTTVTVAPAPTPSTTSSAWSRSRPTQTAAALVASAALALALALA